MYNTTESDARKSTEELMKNKKPVDILLLILAVITAAAITFFAVRFSDGAATLIIAPLYVSVCIILMQSRVNRFAFLLGAVNSLFYGAVYIYDGLYLTALYAILFSFPVQLLTFIRWKKKDRDGETVFKKMSRKQHLLTAAVFAVCFAVFYSILRLAGSDYGIYDTLSMLFGILVTLLCAAPYIEYSPLQVTSVAVGLFMFAKMARAQPIQYTYLTYQAYCLICVSVAMTRIFRIYKKQKAQSAPAEGASEPGYNTAE